MCNNRYNGIDMYIEKVGAAAVACTVSTYKVEGGNRTDKKKKKKKREMIVQT